MTDRTDKRRGGAEADRVGTAGRRRAVYALRAGVLMLAVTASCLFAGLVAQRTAARVDVTATREHRLSPRTLAVLGRLEGPYEVVIAGDLRSADPRARTRALDVLESFERATRGGIGGRTGRLEVTRIDTGSERGMREYDALLERLTARYAGALSAQSAAVEAGAAGAVELGSGLDALAVGLGAARDALQTGEAGAAELKPYLDGRAGMARNAATDLRAGAETAQALMKEHVGRVAAPPSDEAVRAIAKPAADAAAALSPLIEDLRRVMDSGSFTPAARARSRPLAESALGLRDRAARLGLALEAVRPLPLLTLARAIEGQFAAFVLGPEGDAAGAKEGKPAGIAAIEFETLFPPRLPNGLESARPDTRAEAEGLIASAVAAVSDPAPPIVVLLHGIDGRIAPGFAPFSAMTERLRTRGIDLVEWPAGLDAEAPSLARLDPAGIRPVVYLVTGVIGFTPQGAVRMGKVARALDGLIAGGKAVLLTAAPSTLPSIGEKDPMVGALGALGIGVDTGRPLLRQHRTAGARVGGGRTVVAEHEITTTGGEGPIAAAVDGLRTYLAWPVAVRKVEMKDGAGAAVVTPLVVLPADPDVWAESEWLEFFRVPSTQRPLVSNPPSNDSKRDDAAGPWTVAAAVERRTPGGAAQRVIVTGAAGWVSRNEGWLIDPVTRALPSVVDGRRLSAYPGNLELLEASVYWLAGRDELIARTPEAESAPLVPPMAEGRLSAIRWALIAGLPCLTLLAGAAWRALRG